MVSQDFKNNVASGDVVSVRSALVEYLIIDRTFQTFDEYLQYATSMMHVTEEYDNRPFEEDQAKWDMSYLNRQKAALRYNFCEARIEHIKSVISVVMPLSKKPEETPTIVRPPQKSESRTGRTVVRETVHRDDSSYTSQEHPKHKSLSRTSVRTGRKIVAEDEHTETGKKGKISKKLCHGGSTALIVGGTTISVAAILVEKSIGIGAGVVLAGIGCAIKLTSKM
jgi:hypothetical protein